MQELLIFVGVVFMGFFAIMNPISSVPIFLTLTEGEDEVSKQRIAFQSVFTAFLIVLFFVLSGHFILKIFGISFSALRIAGGILVALIGYEMLHGQRSSVSSPTKETIQKTLKEEDTSIAITPLGIPLLSGPGTIITAMSFASGGLLRLIITIIVFAFLCLITYYAFLSGERIKKAFGVSAFRVITRMMGLILSVIGVQMLITGVYSAVREFFQINSNLLIL